MSNSSETGRPADPGSTRLWLPGRRAACELTRRKWYAVSQPTLSVIVRARDEAASIGPCLELVRAQRVHGESAELIVVDSGSSDATVTIARDLGARVLATPPSQFSFGGALNLGAAEARGELLVALSAHAFLPDEQWLARLVAWLEEPRVACAAGERWRPDGSRLTQGVRQDAALAQAEPAWGYSNAAGGFRAELWRARPFRSDLPGCEDKEWSAYWLQRGLTCVIDPQLVVRHDHTHDPVRSIYFRARREAEGLALGMGALGPSWAPRGVGLREVARQWWSDLRYYDSPLRARLSHRRAARLLGQYAGRRRALRRGL